MQGGGAPNEPGSIPNNFIINNNNNVMMIIINNKKYIYNYNRRIYNNNNSRRSLFFLTNGNKLKHLLLLLLFILFVVRCCWRQIQGRVQLGLGSRCTYGRILSVGSTRNHPRYSNAGQWCRDPYSKLRRTQKRALASKSILKHTIFIHPGPFRGSHNLLQGTLNGGCRKNSLGSRPSPPSGS